MNFKKILLSLIFFFLLILPKGIILAQTNEDKIKELNAKIEEYTNKIKELQGQQKTLSATITYFDNKIQLAATQISKTEQELKILEEEIAKLSIKIDYLDKSLEEVSIILTSRIQETYKRNLINPIFYLFSSSGFSDTLSRLKYLQTAQQHDRELLFEMQKSKIDYDNQKKLKEEKQAKAETLKKQLVSQQTVLAQQKKAKALLLEQTKNDEKEYQKLLATARAEFEGIQAILAGKGDETKVRETKEGEKIASLIYGASCNSSDTHLHFSVANGQGGSSNPFSFLKNVDYTNCSANICGSSESDPFNPSGSWNWPLNPVIILNQGYGLTWAVRNTWVGQIYNFHDGIDIIGSSNDVKAVQGGILYRGSYTGRNGCRLPYVRVEHNNSDINTYYMHVNYY